MPTREHVLAHLLHAINVCGADHVGIGSDGGIQKVVLTAGQKAAFEQNIENRKAAGIAAPGEDRFPYVPDLNGPDHMQVLPRNSPSAASPRRPLIKCWARTSSACSAKSGEQAKRWSG